jgi:hypothetical protein
METPMSELFWWTKDWTDEEKRIAGDPQNRIGHMVRAKERVDQFERRIDAEIGMNNEDIFGPIVTP